MIDFASHDLLNDGARLIIGAEAPDLDSIGNWIRIEKFCNRDSYVRRENCYIPVKGCLAFRQTSHEIPNTGRIPILEVRHSHFCFSKQEEGVVQILLGETKKMGKVDVGPLI